VEIYANSTQKLAPNVATTKAEGTEESESYTSIFHPPVAGVFPLDFPIPGSLLGTVSFVPSHPFHRVAALAFGVILPV